MKVRRKKVEDFEWHQDPAASGTRYNAYYSYGYGHPKYRLCAYQDGRYFVDYEGVSFASGDAKSLKQAKHICVLLFNHDRSVR